VVTPPVDSVGGVVDEPAVAHFALPERSDGARLGFPHPLGILRLADGHGQPRELLLQDIIGDAILDAFDSQFFAQRAGDKDKWDIKAELFDEGECIQACPARKAVV
jgi:hypothetical protein